jgi:uncharacterized protein (DUF3820 family)
MLNKRPTTTGKKDFFNMAELTDKSPMPQGKFKGQTMENVPYWHLLWLDGKPFCNRDVQKYIDENRDVLEIEKKRDKYRNDNE